MLDCILNGYVNAMECEHGQIARRTRQLEHSLDAIGLHGRNATAVGSVVEQLVELDRCLADHFKREEEGGFLDDAMTTAPRFAHEAESLLDEHDEMLTRVKDLVVMARAQDSGALSNWQSFAAAARNLIRQLTLHEERENVLLRKAFNVAHN
jgi:iron-sulfur cluster repair protein YtfE (RIC family)